MNKNCTYIPRSKRGSVGLKFLVSIIVVLVIGLIAVTMLMRNGPGNDITNANGPTPPPPPANGPTPPTPPPEPEEKTIIPGTEVTRLEMITIFEGQIDEPMPAVNNVARMKEVFQENTRYRNSGLSTISGRASHLDWGVEGFADFAMALSGIVELFIKENDGRRIVARVDILESSVSEFRAEPGMRVDLGGRFHSIFDAGAFIMGPLDGFTIPPGTSRLGEYAINKFLEGSIGQKIAEVLADTPMAGRNLSDFMIGAPEIGGLHGTRFEVHFEDGKGVQKVIYIGRLKGYERQVDEDFVHLGDLHYLFQAGLFSAPHLFPDRPLRDGEIFNIQASAFPAPFPQSWRANQGGQLSFGRYDETGERGEIYYRRGQFEVRGRPKGREIRGNFQPSEGVVHFYTNPQQMDRLHLKGEASFTDRSTDHWIFEARHQVTPTFEMQYSVEVMDD